jgi:uncharacterized protein (DUF362 family)/Pyruvate/2-oxoacid:ferredoxin oxidoreductase delta subunit
MYDVAFAPCGDYEYARVRAALDDAVARTADLSWLRPGMTVAVKVNLITFAHPDRAATTHPAVVRAVCEMLTERGAQVVVGDSPGGIFTAPYVERVYAACGLTELGFPLNRDFTEVHVSDGAGKICREFDCTAWLEKADAVVDVCKLKTHGMMTLTAGVKNLFGAVPGTKKPEYHFRYPNPADFADMLIDICRHIAPRLTVCDAITAMEGNGPTAGAPRQVGYLAVSENPHALDKCLADLIGLPVERTPTLAAAQARGLLPENMTVFGQPEPIPDYDIPAGGGLLFEGRGGAFGKLRSAVMGRALTARPALTADKCVSCRRCAEVCPAGAIDMAAGKPKIDRKKCIRCFCCQEFCPQGALYVHRSAVARLLSGNH